MSRKEGRKGLLYLYQREWSAHRWLVVEALAVVRGPARDREPCGRAQPKRCLQGKNLEGVYDKMKTRVEDGDYTPLCSRQQQQ